MSIVLIGYRGSGKTTVGRVLADRLSWPLIDSDQRVVAAVGMSIKNIFEKLGEGKFREHEAVAVQEMMEHSDHVLSLGGGALLRESNRTAILNGKHMVVYLWADPIELHRRIHSDAETAANRPSLTQLGGGIEEIRSVLTAREPIYRQVMTAEVDVTHASVDEVVEAILKLNRS